MSTTADALLRIADTLDARRGELAGFRVTSGFDGFVDHMVLPVETRHEPAAFDPVSDIGRFGDLIKASAGMSSLREIVVTATHPGGCTVNMGDGLATLGIPLDCYATLGEPPHPAFAEFLAKCRLFRTWGREPGHTWAFEFRDGKLMFSSVSPLAEFDPDHVRRMLADGEYEASCRASGVIALTTWVLYPHMTAVWKLLQEEVYSKLEHRPWIFLDPADPNTRSTADIAAMLEQVRGFEGNGRCVLGVNGNEANLLAGVLGEQPAGDDPAECEDLAARLRARLGISRVVIHRIRFAASAQAGGTCSAPGPYCPKPKKSTGAGDRFNAGYVLSLLLDLPERDALLVSGGLSGFFVREARSPTPSELAGFLRSWARAN